MRLELKQVQGERVGTKWSFERGRRSLGRSSDCDWQLPDQQRRVSKIHCVLERDRDGFLLVDQSANGSRVDDVVVFEGDKARLADRSRIEFAGLAFVVSISGEPDSDLGDPDASLALSDETLTISSILADIAPGGDNAGSILGERSGEDWLGSFAARGQADRKPISSRNVDIGWDGPPDTSGIRPVLPNDWNADFDYGSQLEHAAAMRVSVPATRRRGPVDDDGRSIVAANDSVAADPFDHDAQPAGNHPVLLGMAALVGELEKALADGLALFDIDHSDAEPMAPGSDQDAQIIARLTTLLLRQNRFNRLLDTLTREASQRLEPRLIEARVDAAARKLPWRGKRGYWQAYRSQFERDGRSLSVLELFREVMLGAGADRNDPDAAGIAEGKNNSR